MITPWDSFRDSRVKLDSREGVRTENKTVGADSKTPCTDQEMLGLMQRQNLDYEHGEISGKLVTLALPLHLIQNISMRSPVGVTNRFSSLLKQEKCF